MVALVVVVAASSASAQVTPVAPVVQAESPWLGLLRPRQGVFGVQIVEVYEDSGAATAGLAPGDEILFIDDLPVTGVLELVTAVQRHAVGDRVEVRALRHGEELAVTVQLTARVDDRELLHRRLVGKPAPAARLRRLDDDRLFDPSALRGKVAVLVWFSTRCDACGDIISELSGWADQRRDVVVAAVTSGEPALVATYLSRSAIGVPVAVASEEDFEQYGVLGARADSSAAFVVIDRDGIVRLAAVIGSVEDAEAKATVDDVIAGARQLLRTRRR
jgi:peroxiredoxin